MKLDVIMSFIFHSHFAMRSLDSLGSWRKIHLVDNSYQAELKGWAARNPHVNYLRPKVWREYRLTGRPEFAWSPHCCAASWNWAMREAETTWVVNVNPDTLLSPHAWRIIEGAIRGRAEGTVLIRTQVNFNVWMADRTAILELGGFDERFKPCAGEDEDMLCRISQAGLKWQRIQVPATHMEGGHKDRADMGMNGKTYPNADVFEEKWGFRPHSPEYKTLVGGGAA
jgi:hypothetical protein